MNVCRSILFLVCLILLGSIPNLSIAVGDWPTFRGDVSRSGRAADGLDAPRLALVWSHQTKTIPQTAWAAAAKYDAFGNVPDLKSMRNYDPVYHPVIAGNRIYFSSSVDQAVHCLDLATGKELWTFTTDGPVRIAPTIVSGKVYFGSDDGYAYCIEAETGKHLWRYAAKTEAVHVIHEGNLIASWPCRTGVLVDNGIAYAAFSLFPWQPSYLVGLNAETGKVDGKGTFQREYTGLTLEGPLLASAEQLICPQGRVAPLLFRRGNGELVGSLPGGGGCMVVIGGDGRVFHGPGNKSGEIYVTQQNSRQRVASYPGATSLVVGDQHSFVLTETELLSVPLKPEGPAGWKKANAATLEVILAGDYLFAGGRDSVVAIRAADGKQVWQTTVRGRAYGLAASGGQLVVSTDEGNLYCFGPDKSLPSANNDAAPVAKIDAETKAGATPTRKGPVATTTFTPVVGPYSRFVGPTTAVVRWQTETAMPSILRIGNGPDARTISDPEPKYDHELTLNDLRKEVLYHYQLAAKEGDADVWSSRYECDTFFNQYSDISPAAPSPNSSDVNSLASLAESILKSSRIIQGLCIDLGCADGKLAAELARRSSLRIICLDDDRDRVSATREWLRSEGLYGTRVVVHWVKSLDTPGLLDQAADLVVCSRLLKEPKLPVQPVTIMGAIRPLGAAVFAISADQASAASDRFAERFSAEWPDSLPAAEASAKNLWVWRRPAIAGSGVWTHQYGTEDNSAYGGESLGGAGSTDELRVQWFGRPGPRAQADRSGRKPGPLAAGGRLFAQGLNRITALSAFNGTLLWSLEVPDFERFNVPRDSSNWCVDDDHVFAVVRDRCWKIRASDGTVTDFLKVAEGAHPEWKYDWGYVARSGELLFGSTVKAGTRHTNFWGGAGWYDDKFGVATFKVCSDRLFALDAATGSNRWSYANGLILNSTITVSSDRICFVESRHPKVLAAEDYRVGLPELWLDQYLVALDARNGTKLWEQPIDTADGNVIFQLAASADLLVLLASDYRYNVYAYDGASGKPRWTQQFDWQSDNHGGHMSRPAIVGNKIFIRPRVLDLKTGDLLKETMPGGGCGSYAATDKSLIFRAGNITMWDMTDSSTTNWHRLRPDCWISTIPAEGLLLSPEGGGGCSCGSWLETSIAFIPERNPPPKIVSSAPRFVDRASVEIIRRGERGELRYTLDGTDPGPDSPVYLKPLELRGSTVVKARTVVPGSAPNPTEQSSIIIAKLEREYPPPLVAPHSIPFVEKLPVSLKLPGKYGEIRFTLDGSDPTADSPKYDSPLMIEKTINVKARVIYDDGTPGAIASTNYQLVEEKLLEPVKLEGLSSGLICESYDGIWKELPDFTKEVAKKTVTVEKIDLSPRTANDAFGLRFHGYVRVPVDGVYSFATRSDDGSRLWIGNRKVVDNDGLHAIVEKSGWVALKAGQHPISIDYWDAVWGEFLEVTYEGPGIAKQQLPAASLFHAP